MIRKNIVPNKNVPIQCNAGTRRVSEITFIGYSQFKSIWEHSI